jgi:hypothetical protein
MSLTPPEKLRDSLLAQREQGATFDLAWNVGCERALRFGPDADSRREWTDALLATRDDWERAYNGGHTAFARVNRDVSDEGPSRTLRIIA